MVTEERMDDLVTPEPELEAPPSPTDALVEGWLVQWFHNLGLPTELQNRIRQAADDLKARLAGKEK